MTQPSDAHSVLPPVPNSETGLPRPPMAPREVGGNYKTPGRSPRRAPAVPDGQGLRLEWEQPRANHRWILVGVVFVLFAVVGYLNTGGWDWITDWVYWLICGVTAALLLWRIKGDWVAVGATWLQHRKQWVNTYELVSIGFQLSGFNRTLDFTDGDGREARGVAIADMQRNPRMWNLIYNGILHSVASGNCEMSDSVRNKVLKIPPELGRPNGDAASH